jgi:hypothetical protein
LRDTYFRQRQNDNRLRAAFEHDRIRSLCDASTVAARADGISRMRSRDSRPTHRKSSPLLPGCSFVSNNHWSSDEPIYPWRFYLPLQYEHVDIFVGGTLYFKPHLKTSNRLAGAQDTVSLESDLQPLLTHPSQDLTVVYRGCGQQDFTNYAKSVISLFLRLQRSSLRGDDDDDGVLTCTAYPTLFIF